MQRLPISRGFRNILLVALPGAQTIWKDQATSNYTSFLRGKPTSVDEGVATVVLGTLMSLGIAAVSFLVWMIKDGEAQSRQLQEHWERSDQQRYRHLQRMSGRPVPVHKSELLGLNTEELVAISKAVAEELRRRKTAA